MKRLITFLSLVIFLSLGFQAGAQSITNYAFTPTSGSFTALSGGTTMALSGGTVDDGYFNSIPIGFTFYYMAMPYTTLAVSTNGLITFGGNLTTSYASNGLTSSGLRPILAPLWDDNDIQLNTNFSYQTSGSLGSRIFTAEWLNVQWNYSATGNTVSHQVKLYEATGAVEFIYRDEGGTVNSGSASIGITAVGTGSGNYLSLNGTGVSPTASSTTETTNLNTKPASGQTYTFTPYSGTPANPTTTTMFTAISGTGMTVNWTDNSNNETYFVVTRATNAGLTQNVVTTVVNSTTIAGTGTAYNLVVTGLNFSTTYYFKITANNEGSAPGTGLTGSQATTGYSFPGGNYTVGGPGTPNYPSLTAAFNAINSQGLTGNVSLILQSGYDGTGESYPITCPSSAAMSTYAIVVYPSVSGLVITSANATGTIDLNGTKNITFDGRVNATGSAKDLVIENSNTAGFAVRFINDAVSNTIKYCILKGVNTSTSSAVVLFSTTTGSTGNDNNTIDNCDILDGVTTPTNGIYGLGTTTSTTTYNSGIIISNCNIFNFYNSTSTTSGGIGISISSGNTDWTITGNSFYQTSTRTTFGASATSNAILVSSSNMNNALISGNYIGGTSPSCGGTPYTLNASTTLVFRAIQLTVGATTPTSIQGNTIQNISVTSTSTSTAQSLISMVTGSFNCGTVSGNTLGSQSITGSVTYSISGSSAIFTAIIAGTGTPGVINIANNTIGGISVVNTGSPATGTSVRGIGVQGAATSYNISGNTIGSTLTANSFSSSTNSSLLGIFSASTSTTNLVQNNTVANLTHSGTGTSAQLIGILCQGSSGGLHTTTGNTVRNLTSGAPNIGTSSSASVIGISHTAATTTGQSVAQNTIFSLSNSHATAAVCVTGIHYAGPTTGTNLVARNFVHSLSIVSTSATADMRGINLASGLVTFQNNMVRLGINDAGNSLTTGIQITGIYDFISSANSAIYFNSVYIGGTGVGTETGNTYAFRSDQTTNVRKYMNNAFYNARSNAAGGGKHFAVRVSGTGANPTGLTLNFNDYLANGTGAVFGYYGADVASFSTWQTAVGQDANSINVDPQYNNPAGTSSTLNLHIITGASPNALESAAFMISGLTNDYDNDTRPGPSGSVNGGGYSPDMGADEFDGFNPGLCTGTPASGGTASATASQACVGNLVTFTVTGATVGAGIQYQWQSSPTGLNTWANVSGAISTVANFAPLLGIKDYRCLVTCGPSGLSVASTLVTVEGYYCQYDVTRTTGITYNSIITTGSTYTSLTPSSGDDARTNVVTLSGTTFKYGGITATGFYATTNGWLTFNTAQTSYSLTNDLTATGQNTVVAPFWDDLVIKGNNVANLNISMRYQVNGTLGSGSADIIIEWADMERWNFGPPNINFQVVLHESDNSIDINYGNMQLWDGSATTTLFSYSVGLNQANPAGTTLNDRMILQRENTSYFSTTSQTALAISPACYTRLRFIPAFYTGTDPGAPGVPANNESAGAITATVNSAPCTSICGNIYTSKNATASAGIAVCSAGTPGNPDDDVWFKFITTSATSYKIDVTPSLNYDAVVQLLDGTLTPVNCVNAGAIGISESFTSALTSGGATYYIRIYDAAASSGGTGEFALCVSEYVPPPTNDECAGATALAVNTACVPTSSQLPATLGATASTGIPVCGAGVPGNPDDDVWYSFTTSAVSGAAYKISVTGVGTYNAVLQLLSGTCGTLAAVTCVNATGNGGTETISTNTLIVSTTYYIRVYHSGTGAANGNFSVCVYNPPPDCATIGLPLDGAIDVDIFSTLTWTAGSTGGIPTGYYLYFGTDGGGITPPTNFENGTDQTSPYNPGSLLFGQTYYWQVVPYNASGSATGCDIWSFTTVPLCPGPTGLNTSDITTTSAKLNWTYGTPPDSFFDVFWGPDGFDPDVTGTLITGVNSGYTLQPPLQPSTAYDWYVRANCGEFYAPAVDYFFMAMDGGGNLMPPPESGGTSDDPGEDGKWYNYDQAPGDIDWWNIWFYNAPLDTNRMKKIRMGFWIQSYDGVSQGLVNYVVNWSDSTWLGSGFPAPMDEDHIERSPVNGPVVVTPGLAQWVEFYYEIPNYNPEWVSVDIFGENIQILEVSNEPPPPNSPLFTYWYSGMPGGIIVHECLPKPYGNISPWIGPASFTTTCGAFPIPYTQNFDAVTTPAIPLCMSVTNDNADAYQWETSASYPRSAPNSMYIRWNSSLAMNDWFFTPALTLAAGAYKVSFWYRSSGATFPEKLEVKWGSAPNAAGMTSGPIFDNNNIINTAFVEGTGYLSVITPGDYYVGWHGYSAANMFYLVVDDISIEIRPFIWTGNVSADWTNPGNWDRGSVPGVNDRVIIPTDPVSNPDIFPVIANGQVVNCYSMSVGSGANVKVELGGTLNILNP